MTSQFNITLPEISVENFEHTWTRFQFAAMSGVVGGVVGRVVGGVVGGQTVVYTANSIVRHVGGT